MVDISELTEIVEDTVKTLDYIRAHSDFVTVHVSSFME